MKKYSFDELLAKAEFTPQNKVDEKKAQIAYSRYIKGYENGDSGCFGKAVEVLTRRPLSRKTKIAGFDEADCTALIDGKYIDCERKTNGGRIDDIKEKYVIYSLCVHNSNADIEISRRIIKADTFINALYSFNAVKEVRHNGVVDGIAIQPSNRQLWRWLETMPKYDRTKEYKSTDIL